MLETCDENEIWYFFAAFEQAPQAQTVLWLASKGVKDRCDLFRPRSDCDINDYHWDNITK